MACDYRTIRDDNKRRYGTDIARIGPMLLADRYDDRTHFIFELLQNAEDALARRAGWQGSRAVSFHLTENALGVSHFGQPFNEADVRGICGIAESTKDVTEIGRFGIGFKSVYAFTERPEIHSGTEDFAIESFVWPVAAPPIDRDPDETVILIPLNPNDESGHREVAAGLGRLGASALLFLRQIEEIRWSVEGGRSGVYLRESKEIDSGVRRVTVIGQEHGQTEVDQEWLLLSRPVTAGKGCATGHVEIAYKLIRDEELKREKVQRVEQSPLAVFFPTVVETHLGFLVQGPYRTTPSRDNVPRGDAWNRCLVGETASLLVEALRWLRDHEFLDTAAVRCLPLDSTKFSDTSMFAPLFEATKRALASEPLLPRFDAGHVLATRARLGRTQELRELFGPAKLSALYAEEHTLAWLSGDITQDRAPEVRRYLMQELDVAEVTPETIVRQLDQAFLEAQPDEWIRKLYEYLGGQPGLRQRLADVPLIRLEHGGHVPPQVDGHPKAFLPGTNATGFPTVRATACASETAREFLRSLGLTEPDPVDDVVLNVLPRYHEDDDDVSGTDYETDILRIVSAFATDSKAQREKLIAALRETAFVMAVDSGDKSRWISKPCDVYLATERLKELFAGVGGVLLVDNDYACLRGEDVRELLEACGVVRYLQPVPVEGGLSWEELSDIRRNAGLERATWERPISDVTLRGLDTVLNVLPRLEPAARRHKTALVWEALADVESRRGSRAFAGEYTWSYSHETKTASFDAAFVRHLNAIAWVPDPGGELQRPEFVFFDTLGWKANSFLQSMIRFKPPVIEALAREAGIEPGALDLLKKLGLTGEAELRERLGVKDEPADTIEDALKKLLGDAPTPTPPVPDPAGSGGGGGGTDTMEAGGGSSSDKEAGTGGAGHVDGRGTGSASIRTPGCVGGRPFISYVAAQPHEEVQDLDGLDQEARMALEAHAVDFILSREPAWQRTPTHNPGYDLYQADEHGQAKCWCEVKAMTGSLHNRPVGLSRTQFEHAREHGEMYWLYVVEHAETDHARIVRIQDPAGKARTFTFDHGWLDVANVDREQEHQED